MIKNIYCRERRLSMEEGKLREALYSEYCKARGILSLDDAGIDKFLQGYINENCDKYDIGKLNNYCNLAPNNKSIEDITTQLVVTFDKMYNEHAQNEIEYEESKKSARKSEEARVKSKWFKAGIAVVVFLVVLHFDFWGFGDLVTGNYPVWQKALGLLFWLGIVNCFVWNVGAFIGGAILVTFLSDTIRSAAGENGMYAIYFSVAGIGIIKFVVDIVKPIIMSNRNKRLDEESAKKQQRIADELTKERKSGDF